MIYDNIIIDISNLFYRLLKKEDSSKEITKRMIKFIEEDTMAHCSKDGSIYIIFDPISKNDLGESKSFEVTSYRKVISKDYKKGRVYSPIFRSTIELFMKYFAYRGEKIKLIYSQKYEADDFVEPLLKMISGKKNALVSTDEDWARYIDENTFLISRGYDNPFDKKEFFEKFKFMPTPAANTLYKAIFGDKSDNITGCIFLKKAKFITNIKKTCYNYIKYVSDNNETLDKVENDFHTEKFSDIVSNAEKTPFQEIFCEFTIASQKESVLGKFFLNINLIRSQLENTSIEKFIHWNEERPKYNDVIKQAIFGLNMESWFGRV